MEYVSTRGGCRAQGFREALLGGLARDGGLYLPAAWPELTMSALQGMDNLTYEETALRVMRPYTADTFEESELRGLIGDAYSGFTDPERTPLVPAGPNCWLLELHHGPTLAFKDLAMQLLARMMEAVLARQGERATVLGATSGDTGSAAIEAFRGSSRVSVFILFPEGRVSEVQRRQMTVPGDSNVHAIAIRGDFDDAQGLVKAMFNDHEFRDRLALVAINSINLTRILVQAVYYFFAALRLRMLERGVVFCVPTGNFGDVFAGYAALRMGLPLKRLVIATNSNDILHEVLETGRGTKRTVMPTSSPSMDIQVPSNFERALFEAAGRDGKSVRERMEKFSHTGVLTLQTEERSYLNSIFVSARASEAETNSAIRRTAREHGILVDPHTAVGLHALESVGSDHPSVVLATAHPAKFPGAVEAASGHRPKVPERLKAALCGRERYEIVDARLDAVKQTIEKEMQW